jgi:hypothetical protein
MAVMTVSGRAFVPVITSNRIRAFMQTPLRCKRTSRTNGEKMHAAGLGNISLYVGTVTDG